MIKEILDLARWAPSADNTQTWRFEIINDHSARIHSFDLRKKRDYDYQGNYSQFSLGCLLETIRIASTGFHHPMVIEKSKESKSEHIIYDLSINRSESIETDPLFDVIKMRTSNRFPLKSDKISPAEKTELEKALPEEWKILWFESTKEKLKIASMMYAFDLAASSVTTGIIEWNTTFSKTHLPDESLGLDRINLWIARWMFKKPSRAHWLLNNLGVAYFASFIGFFIPSCLCAGHFAIKTPRPMESPDDFILSGIHFQRLWLMATKLGLFLQLETGPIIFSRYVRDDKPYTKNQKKWKKAQKLKVKFTHFFGQETAPHIVMLSRIGKGKKPESRAIRLSLEELKYNPEEFGDYI